MNITILLFATLKDRAQRSQVALALDEGATVGDLKTRLAADLPALAPALRTALVSVNREFAFQQDALHDGDEVGLFPPVSGGAGPDETAARGAAAKGAEANDAGREPPTIFRITNDQLDLNALVGAITLPTTGAACVFTGMVRGETTRPSDPLGPRQTLRLEYEAYAPMAERKMRQVADEIRARWPAVEGIAIVQRIGLLEPGTPTVLIACSAGHRDTGVFEAARYGIDRLKQIVPVWKKEIGPNGEEWIEGHYAPEVGDRVAGDENRTTKDEKWSTTDG